MRRSLSAALLLSIAVHLVALFWPGVEVLEVPEPPGDAKRLEARFLPPPTRARPVLSSIRKSATPRPGAAQAVLPGDSSEAVAEASAPTAGAGAVLASASEPLAAESEVPASASVPASSSVEEESTPVAFMLPQQGRVLYSGAVGGAVGLQAYGEASWTHDGVTLKSRLSAGLNTADGVLDFRSVSRLSGPQIISESTDDQRLSKHSTSQIDQVAGLVHMQRGQDTRERTIKGLAVSLSALPQMLAMLDGTVQKAAIFVVGDFWVEDSLLIAVGEESQRLPVGSIRTRHFQSRTDNGKLIDIWLAPEWDNAPARIRIQFDGYTVDLKAARVEINNVTLANAPEALPPE